MGGQDNGQEPSEETFARQSVFARFLLLLIGPTLLLFGLYDLLFVGARTVGLACVAMSAFAWAMYGLFRWRGPRVYPLVMGAVMSVAGVFFVVMFGRGLAGGAAVVWIPTLPVVTLYLVGVRRGLPILVVSVAALTAWGLAAPTEALFAVHAPANVMRMVVSTAIATAFCVALEHSRRVAEDILQRKNGELAAKVTELERTQLDLQRASEEAQAASRAKSMFLAKMSHEIRTPMNGVHGMTQLLLDTPLDAGQQGIAETIQMSTRSLQKVINDILDFSKIEAGRMELTPAPTDVAALADRLTRLLKSEAEARGLTLRTQVAPLPVVRLDEARVLQILVNLCGNAIKFTEAGFVELDVRARGDVLRFSVRDTGDGIDVENKARLFEAFDQGTDVENFKGGTGLGLAISAELCALMGGRLDGDNHPDGGAVFWFEVPLVSAADAAVSTPAPTTEAGPLRLHVLVAEDHRVNQRVVEGLLRSLGCTVEVVSDGAEAVARCHRARFDVVLMDMQMPEVDGLEATRRIRARGDPTPIIALTANALSDARQACLDAGMNGFLTKPIERRALSETLQRWAAPTPVAEPRPIALMATATDDGLRRSSRS